MRASSSPREIARRVSWGIEGSDSSNNLIRGMGSPRVCGHEGLMPPPAGPVPTLFQMRTRRSRSALPMTETELKVIAAAAIIGDSSRPNDG